MIWIMSGRRLDRVGCSGGKLMLFGEDFEGLLVNISALLGWARRGTWWRGLVVSDGFGRFGRIIFHHKAMKIAEVLFVNG